MKRSFAMLGAVFTFLLGAGILSLAQTPVSAFDVVITNGHIIDGTGSPWYSGDVGIRDRKIAAIGNLAFSPRKRTIDAAGKTVAPGFIDLLGQSELTILVDPRLPSKIFQGITTEITGEGGSAAPLNDAIIQADRPDYDHYKITADWRTFRQYFVRLEKQGMGINLASYVGATQVRRMVLGDDDKQPTPEQLDQMKALVRDAMKDGTVGVSTSLQYPPAPYAKTDELIALAAEEENSAASIPHTCATKGIPNSRQLMRHCASDARHTFPWRSGTSKSRARTIGGECLRSSRRSTRLAPREQT